MIEREIDNSVLVWVVDPEGQILQRPTPLPGVRDDQSATAITEVIDPTDPETALLALLKKQQNFVARLWELSEPAFLIHSHSTSQGYQIAAKPLFTHPQQFEMLGVDPESLPDRALTQFYLDKIASFETEIELRSQELIHSERMASIGTLAAGVAHEINNPLAYVKSNLISLNGFMKPLLGTIDKLLELDVQDKQLSAILKKHHLLENRDELKFISEDTVDILDDLQDGVDRIVTIVSGLRQYSHTAANAKEPIDLNDVIRTAVELSRNEIKHRGTVELSLEQLPFIEVNSSELTQVIVNLLVNAAQALDKPSGRILVRSSADQNSVTVELEDNGSGISEADLSQIFTPFFTTKPVGEGTGLGLAISQRIVEKHQGEISVESTPGEGTLFRLTFPRTANQ